MQLNPTKPFAGMFATLVFMYLIYLLLATDPLERMNRICEPLFVWPAKVVVAGLNLFSPGNAPAVQAKFDSGFNTCRRWVWGAFYESEYQKLQAEAAQSKASAK